MRRVGYMLLEIATYLIGFLKRALTNMKMTRLEPRGGSQ